MPDTFIKIASVTVGSGGSASISFTSIPADYTDLCLKYSTRLVGGGVAATDLLSLNGSTSTFTCKNLQGAGSGTPSSGSGTREIGLNNGNSSTASTFANSEIYFTNYASSSNKSYSVDSVTENNATTAYTQLVAGLWSTSSAITSITITPDTSSYAQYSTAVLYGIKNS